MAYGPRIQPDFERIFPPHAIELVRMYSVCSKCAYTNFMIFKEEQYQQLYLDNGASIVERDVYDYCYPIVRESSLWNTLAPSPPPLLP